MPIDDRFSCSAITLDWTCNISVYASHTCRAGLHVAAANFSIILMAWVPS